MSAARTAGVRPQPGRGGTGLGSARERFERRAASARRRPRLVWGGVLALLALVGAAVWVLWFSPLLQAEKVVVQTGPGVSAAEQKRLLSVAAVPLGGPLMRVDTDAVAARVTADKALRDVSVERAFPHTVVVRGTPRVAMLALKNPKGQVDIVDDQGVVFRVVTAPPAGIPLVTADAPTVSESGRVAALECIAALPPDWRGLVRDMRVTGADQVTFAVQVKGSDPPVVKNVRWGGRGDAALKATVVTTLASQPGSTIDVSAPLAPVVR